MQKKSISILLSLIMVFSVLWLPAYATDDLSDSEAASDIQLLSDIQASSSAEQESEAEPEFELNSFEAVELSPQASAETQNTFKVTFDSLEAGKSFNTSNGATNVYGASIKFLNEVDGAKTGNIARNSSITATTIEERAAGNNAIKIVTNGTANDTVTLYGETTQPVTSGDIVHFSFGLRTDDMNCEKAFTMKTSVGYEWNFLKFNTDGTISFFGKYVDSYSVGTWYDVDLYYMLDEDVWHLFINGKYMERWEKTINMTNVQVARLNWTAPAGKTTTVYVDQLAYDYASLSDLKGADRVGSYETITFATSQSGSDACDSANLKFGNFSAGGMVSFAPKAGVLGKSSIDKALNISNPAGYYPQTGMGYLDYEGFAAAEIEPGSKLYYSTQLSIDDSTSNRVWIEGIFQNNRPVLFEVSADGSAVKAVGKEMTGVSFAKNKWYRVDLVITVGEDGVSNNTLNVYLNGKKLNSSAISFSADTADNVAITSATIRTGSYLKTETASESDSGYDASKTKYAANSFWIDDIVAAIYPPEKAVILPTFTFINPNVSIYSDRVENVGSQTVAEFLDGTYINIPYYIIDTDGKAVTDTSVGAKGKTLVLAPMIGSNIYISIYHIPFPADYTEPTVEITSPVDGSKFVFGFDESVTIKADATAYSTIESVRFYLDGNLLTTDTIAPYEYEWNIPESLGDHVIKAEVIDYYGTAVQSNEVTVNIKVNQKPKVTFTGLDSENTIYLGDDFAFTLSSEDIDGTIARTELYLNNEIYDTFTSPSKEYSIDFGENGRFVLKAVSYDDVSATGTAQCVVNVLKQTTVDVASLDFEGYSSGKTFANSESISGADFTKKAIVFGGERGKREIVSQNGNNFLMAGVTEDTASGSSSPYVAANYMISNAVVEYETDICFARNDIDHTANCRGDTKGGTALHMYSFKFDKNGNVMVQNGSAYVDVGDYSANTWYRLKLKFDIPNRKLDFSLTNLADPTDKCEAIGHNFQYSDYYLLQQIRIETKFDADNPGYIAYDNMVMKYTANYPSITGFTDNLSTENGVSSKAASVYCVMSEAVGEIQKDHIVLENDFGVVAVESVEVDDFNIIITPKDGFLSSSNYKLTIKSEAPLADGADFGFDTVAYFETDAAAFDVVDGQFTSNSSGIVFTADFVNTTAKSQSCTIVTTTYKGDVLTGVFSKTVSIPSSGKASADAIVPSDSYDSIKAFVIYDWTDGVPLSAKSFIFSK